MKNGKMLSLLFVSSITVASAMTTVSAYGRYSTTSSQGKPNLIYMMCDDLTAEAISAYGGRYKDIAPTPNIDRLANEGAILNNVYATNAICVPSRANVLTGLPSEQSGVYTLQDVLNPEINTFPKEFQKNGYATSLIGKWHQQSEPQGFDYYHILEGQGQYGPSVSTPNAKTVPYINSRLNPNWPAYIADDPATGAHRYNNPNKDPYAPNNSFPTDHVTVSTTHLAMEWLKNTNGKERDQSKPFMLMVNHKAPHVPNNGYALNYTDYLKDVNLPMPESYEDNKEYRDIAGKDFGMIRGDKTYEEYQEDIKGYLRLVKGVDDELGKLLDYLDLPENASLKENTAIVFTSDQGLFLGEHHYSDKRWIFQESARMPFLVRYPKEIAAKTVCNDYITSLDFAPTFLDYGDMDKPVEMVGRSFRENLKGNTPSDWEQSAYFRYFANADANVPAHYGIRTEDYLLNMYTGMSLDMLVDLEHVNKQTPVGGELYDLKNDPNETKNLYYVPEYQDIVSQMKILLEKRKADVEGQHDELRYPELTERMDAFNAGEKDIPIKDGNVYAINNNDLFAKDEASQDLIDEKNSKNLETAEKYTQDLIRRSRYGDITVLSAPIDQSGNPLDKDNLKDINEIKFDVNYKYILENKVIDPMVSIYAYNQNGKEIGSVEEKTSLAVGRTTITVSSLNALLKDAKSIKIVIDNDGQVTEIPLDGNLIPDSFGKVVLPMNYFGKPSANASLTLNKDGSGLLENWTNLSETVTWTIDVPSGLEGKYVVSSSYMSTANSNFNLTNQANNEVMETALRENTSLYKQNFGTIDLKVGLNPIVLSRNADGNGKGVGNIKLSDFIFSKIDTSSFASINTGKLPKTLSLNDSIRFGNRVFHTGDKLFQWDSLNNGLMWKVHLEKPQALKIKCDYILGNQDYDPNYTIRFLNPTTGDVVQEVSMQAVNRYTKTGFGNDWDTSSNQILGVSSELPVGDYILELGKKATSGAVVATFVKNVSLVSTSTADTPMSGLVKPINENEFDLPLNEYAHTNRKAVKIENNTLTQWTTANKANKISWCINVSEAGRYVVSGKVKVLANTNLVITNKTNGKNFETAFLPDSPSDSFNFGIIELEKGNNEIVLSRNSGGFNWGNGVIDLLSPLKLSKIDTAFQGETIVKDTPKQMNITASILNGRYTNPNQLCIGKDGEFGYVTYKWEAPNNNLLWKVTNSKTQDVQIWMNYAFNHANNPLFTIHFENIKTGMVYPLTMDSIQGKGVNGFGQNLSAYSNQTCGVLKGLPKGDYIVKLGKTNNIAARVRSITFQGQ